MNPSKASPADGPPRDWLRYYPAEVPASLNYPEEPVTSLLESAAHRFPERPACTLFGRALNYVQAADQARGLAGSLANLGARRGRFVGILLPNMPEYLVALQATWHTGAAALLLSPLMAPAEIDKWLAATGCHLLVTLDLLRHSVKKAREQGLVEHLVVTSLAGRLSLMRGLLYRLERVRRNGVLRRHEKGQVHRWDTLVGRISNPSARIENPSHLVEPREDVAVVVPTGGTTASPKAVMLTHANLLANALQLRAWSVGPDGSEDILGALPFFHVYGLTVGLLTSLAKAATIHLLPRFQARAVLDLIARYQIALMPAVPAMLHALNESLRKKPRDLSFIRAVISGASALDAAVRAEFQRFGPRLVVEGYGLSEASPVTHVNPFNEHNRPGAIGIPLPDTDARIVDAETGEEELPVGAVGELVVRGPQVMKGYFNNPSETARALRQGWLYTGDLARRDKGGFFTLVDRKKDIIKTSGFLVFPAEVEEVLCAFAGVAEAAVIGARDHECGEIVKAFVVPRQGARLKVPDLEKHCRERLGRQKLPRLIEVVAELPKNFLGKVQRRQLRELAERNGEASGT